MEWQSYLDTNRPDLFEWVQAWGPKMRDKTYIGYRKDNEGWVLMYLDTATTKTSGFIAHNEFITHWAPLLTAAPEPPEYRVATTKCCYTCTESSVKGGCIYCVKYDNKKVKPNYMCMEWEG